MGRRGPRPEPLAVLFWTKVERPSPAACWTWLGAVDQRGVAIFGEWLPELAKTRTWRAVHMALLLTGAEVPRGTRIGMRCGRGVCVNPAHTRVRASAGQARTGRSTVGVLRPADYGATA